MCSLDGLFPTESGESGEERRQQSSRVVLNAVALWRLLDRREISQNALARLVGTSSGYMSNLVSGKRSPSPQMRRRLQQVLRVANFDDLFIIRHVDQLPLLLQAERPIEQRRGGGPGPAASGPSRLGGLLAVASIPG